MGPPGLLAQWRRAAPDLDRRLRAAGLRSGPDRWQNVHDLLLALAASGRLPADLAGLAPLIGSQLVASAEEQDQFAGLFAHWLAAWRPPEPAARAGAGRESGPARRAAASPERPVPVPTPRLRWLLLGLLLALLAAIGLPAARDDLLAAPDLRAALKRLHQPVTLPARALDPARTVERTARQGGLFRPVPRRRRRVPALVVLRESAHADDQMAGLASQLLDRLAAAGLELHRYDYRGSPRRAVGADGRWWALTAILARHQGARLLLIGEPAALLDAHTGQPARWVVDLAPAAGARGLLYTRRPPRKPHPHRSPTHRHRPRPMGPARPAC